MVTKERLLEILDKSRPDDTISWYTEVILASLILLNLVAISLESVPSLGEKYTEIFLYFEIRNIN